MNFRIRSKVLIGVVCVAVSCYSIFHAFRRESQFQPSNSASTLFDASPKAVWQPHPPLSQPNQSVHLDSANTRQTDEINLLAGSFENSNQNTLVLSQGISCNRARVGMIDPLAEFNRAVQWHNEHPSGNYLVYSTKCGSVGGFGSRLWGIANVFLWALLTNRTFVMEYESPHSLESCFEPNIVPWNRTLPVGPRHRLHLVDTSLPAELLLSGDISAAWHLHPIVEVCGANMPSEPLLRRNSNYNLSAFGIPTPCSDKGPSLIYPENQRRFDTNFHLWKSMVWHALLRPTKPLMTEASLLLKRLKTYDYTLGIHIRLGGQFGGIIDAERKLSPTLDWQHWMGECAVNLTRGWQSSSDATVAWVVASDHPNSTATNFLSTHAKMTQATIFDFGHRVVHTDRTPDQSLREWRETVAEWYVLSQTSHIVQFPSSFSLTASMWGGIVPTMVGEACHINHLGGGDGTMSSSLHETPVASKNPYSSHLKQIQKDCGELCNTTITGPAGKYFQTLTKAVDCKSLWTSSVLDAGQRLSPEPPREIPTELREHYTYGGRVAVKEWYFNERSHFDQMEEKTSVWTKQDVDDQVNQARLGKLKGGYSLMETNLLREAMKRMDLTGKHVLVIGSRTPWVEACALEAGARHVTSVEYSKLESQHPNISVFTPVELREKLAKVGYDMPMFDAVLTFSSIEHAGLGRYGDELNPWGDIVALAKAWCITKPGGKVLVGVNHGQDTVVWNAHRIYGSVMWPHLAVNWIQDWRDTKGSQRIHILRKP